MKIHFFILLSFLTIFGCGSKKSDGGPIVNNNSSAANVFTASTPASKNYTSGETIDFTLSFPAVVTVTGLPELPVTVGTSTKAATFVSGSGSKDLLFRYTIQSGDNDSNGITLAGTIDLNGGSLVYGGNSVACPTTFSAPALSGVKIDTQSPSILGLTSPANSLYTASTPMVFTLNFSEPVVVTGAPRIALTVGATTKYATYSSGSNTTSINFQYSISSGDADPDGIEVSSPLDLNSGSITDAAGNGLSSTSFTPPATTLVTVDGNVVTAPLLSYASSTGTTGKVGELMTVSPSSLSDGNSPVTSCGPKIPLSSLPAWASVNSSTCQISGTPDSTLASESFILVATNSAGTSADATVTLTVNPNTPLLSFSGATGTTMNIGASASISPTTLSSRGASISGCSISPALPAGLSINSLTCVISGTPTSAYALTTHTVSVTNSEGSTSSTLSLQVTGQAPTISYSASTGKIGSPLISMSVTPSTLENGGSAISSCTIAPALPSGLTIHNTTCVISGTPSSVLSETTYTVTVTNAIGSSTTTLALSVIEKPYLSFPLSQGGYLNQCIGPFKVATTDSAGAFDAVDSTTTIHLSSNSSGADDFYDNSTCSGAPSSTTTILSGSYLSSSFYYRTDTSGVVTLTASDPAGMINQKSNSIEVKSRVANTWLAQPTGATRALRGHSAIWTGSEMIVWGGAYSTISNTNAGQRYNPLTDAWGPVTSLTSAPTARHSHSAIWTGTHMIIWGGFSSSAYVNTGGLYNPVTNSWQSTSVTSAPTSRADHSAIWTGTEMIIWGGTNGSVMDTGARYNPSNDSWDGSTSLSGAPSARASHSAVWTGTEMIIWGSTGSGARYNPQNDSWTGISSTATNRSNHSAIWNGTDMIIWGGVQSGTNLNTGLRYNLSADQWTTLTQSGTPPAIRQEHSAVWTGNEMLVWGGGTTSTTFLNTGGRFNPITNTWGTATAVTNSNIVSNRSGASAVWTGSEMVIWGGIPVSTPVNTGGRYNPVSNSWGASTATVGAPTARGGHSAVWTGTEMIIYGGTSGVTGSRYNPITDSWLAIPNGSISRSSHTAVWTGTEMIVWGGASSATTFLNSGERFNLSSNSWVGSTSLTNAPTARYGHSGVWTGTEMIIWGGATGDMDETTFQTPVTNTGARYNLSTDSWQSIDSSGAPTSRGNHSAIWTGTHMIVWGGALSSFNTFTNTGGRYNPSSDSWGVAPSMVGAPSARGGHTAVWTGYEMIVWGGNNVTSNVPYLYFP
jgi:N-acetylneuraminic acid mutarotase